MEVTYLCRRRDCCLANVRFPYDVVVVGDDAVVGDVDRGKDEAPKMEAIQH